MIGLGLALLAGLVGLSRVATGAHYPGDVLSGALTGTALAELTRWLIEQGDHLNDQSMLDQLRERFLSVAESITEAV